MPKAYLAKGLHGKELHAKSLWTQRPQRKTKGRGYVGLKDLPVYGGLSCGVCEFILIDVNLSSQRIFRSCPPLEDLERKTSSPLVKLATIFVKNQPNGELFGKVPRFNSFAARVAC